MKFAGMVGFWEMDEEVNPGVYRPRIVERFYTGDLKRNFRKFDSSSKQNEDISTSNQIEILADLYTQSNYMSIRYVVWNGQRISAKNVTIDYPRIVIELGGVYSGPRASNETA